MKRLVEFALESGGSIVVEVDEQPQGIRRAGRAEAVDEKAVQTFEKSLDRIKPIAGALVDRVRDLADPPDEVEVQFGIKLSGSLGAIIATASGEANYSVKLAWKRQKPDASPAP